MGCAWGLTGNLAAVYVCLHVRGGSQGLLGPEGLELQGRPQHQGAFKLHPGHAWGLIWLCCTVCCIRNDLLWSVVLKNWEETDWRLKLRCILSKGIIFNGCYSYHAIYCHVNHTETWHCDSPSPEELIEKKSEFSAWHSDPVMSPSRGTDVEISLLL